MSDVSPDSVSRAGFAEAGQWLSIQAAARHLSVSERTIYRRADRGQLQRRTLPDARVEVWVADAELIEVSDVSDDTVSQERAVLLVDRVSTAVTRQLEAMTVELAASRERIEVLARENGSLTERVAGLERELAGVRQLSDDDRQRLTSELEAARAALDDLRAGRVAELELENCRLSERLALMARAEGSGEGREMASVPEIALESFSSLLRRPGSWIVVLAMVALAAGAAVWLVVLR